MRIKLDENLPEGPASLLAALGHDVDSVRGEGLTGFDDSEVWTAAQRDERFFITQDLDFSDSRKFMPGTHHGILLVRLHQAGRLYLTRRVVQVFTMEAPASWSRCFVVLSDHRLRYAVRANRVPISFAHDNNRSRRRSPATAPRSRHRIPLLPLVTFHPSW